jgi:hypothetical protein
LPWWEGEPDFKEVLAQWRAVWFDCVFGVDLNTTTQNDLAGQKIPDLLTDLAGRNSKLSEAGRAQ